MGWLRRLCGGLVAQAMWWVESRIKLISAEAEAEALLGLAELGNKKDILLVTIYLMVGLTPSYYFSLKFLT